MTVDLVPIMFPVSAASSSVSSAVATAGNGFAAGPPNKKLCYVSAAAAAVASSDSSDDFEFGCTRGGSGGSRKNGGCGVNGGKVDGCCLLGPPVAGSDISVGCVSGVFHIEVLFKEENCDLKEQVKVYERNSELHAKPNNINWQKFLRLSEDCHSQNLQLQKISGHPSKFIIRAVKNIRKGDILSLWVSEEVTVDLGLPFLSPVNIQGGGRYTCHRCPVVFTHPNPLKLHLAINCQTPSSFPPQLWIQLGKSVEKNTTKTTQSPFAFFLANAFTTSKKSHVERTLPTHFNSLSAPFSSVIEPSRNFRSAFTPLHRRPHNPLTSPMPPFSFSSSLGYPLVPLVQPVLPPSSHSTLRPTSSSASTSQSHAHAEMEALVSSLGRSKQGHLCLYCGKLYSRKYGLKIHLRTHTGYKPLKCRVCLRPFGDPSNLNKHIRLHAEGETPYRCDHCGKVLVRRRDLERHVRSRHPTNHMLDEEEFTLQNSQEENENNTQEESTAS